LGGGRRREPIRYLTLKVGPKLAAASRFTQKPQRIRLMFGGGSDAGKIAVVIDQEAGAFLAKPQKNGCWLISLSARDCAGLFSLDFEPFEVKAVEAIRPENGKSPMFVFRVSAAMLAVED